MALLSSPDYACLLARHRELTIFEALYQRWKSLTKLARKQVAPVLTLDLSQNTGFAAELEVQGTSIRALVNDYYIEFHLL